MRTVLVCSLILGCGTAEMAPSPPPSEAAPEAPAAEVAPEAPNVEPVAPGPAVPAAPEPAVPVARALPTGPLAPLVSRSRGDVSGGLEAPNATFVQGAPMLFRFSMRNVGSAPIPFQDGGDFYAPGPLHYTWLVTSTEGDVECDLRGRPGPMAGGGGSIVRALAPGDALVTWLAPQTGCDALTAVGRHHARVVRILTNDVEAPPLCATILVPDTTREPIDDRGVPIDEACRAFLMARAAVASELDIDVLPYDRDAVRAAIRAELADPDEEHRGALSSYAIWLAYALGREPEWGVAPDIALGHLMDALPASWPE